MLRPMRPKPLMPTFTAIFACSCGFLGEDWKARCVRSDSSSPTPVEDEIRVLVVNSMLAPGVGRRNEMACKRACCVIEITRGMESARRLQNFSRRAGSPLPGAGPDWRPRVGCPAWCGAFPLHARSVLQATYARCARLDARHHEKTFQTWPERIGIHGEERAGTALEPTGPATA